jgi:hypothetical protein
VRVVAQASLVFIVAFMFFSVPPACLGQDALSASKAQAISKVRVATLPGWRETLSCEGRFRVLFPCDPENNDDVISVKELMCTRDGLSWLVSYSELPRAVQDSELKQRYHQANRAISGDENKLIAERDVFLNGRLGNETVIAKQSRVTYMRSFISRSRLYVISVDRKKHAGSTELIPRDVQNFFDSFVYWDKL